MLSAHGGGHSSFNIVTGGIVIDLATYAAVSYDKASQTVKFFSLSAGERIELLAAEKLC